MISTCRSMARWRPRCCREAARSRRSPTLLAALAPAAAHASCAEKKKSGGGSYVPIPTLLGSTNKPGGARGVLIASQISTGLENDLRVYRALVYNKGAGVLHMLRRLLADHKADYAACVFDATGQPFRDDWYPEYKAHRPSMPEDLARQIGPLRQLVEALGWPVLSVEGVEADDVIATLTEQSKNAGWRCVISTGSSAVQIFDSGVCR